MGIDFVGRPVGDVHPAAIRFPSGDARGETVVGIGDAAVMLFAIFVFFGVRSGIAAQPELLDELLAFVVGGQALENLPLLIGDDVGNFLVQPALVRSLQFFLELRFLLLALLVGHRFGNRFALGRRGAAGSRCRRVLRSL